jgi:flagellar basal-body rod modification protein FlgD
MTQLQNQDPLNPMDDQGFVAQLATFSSLEQLTDINAGITKLNTANTTQSMYSAASLIGKDITAAGNTVSKSGTDVGSLSYTLPSAASDVVINITNSSGSVVRSVDQKAKAAGTFSYQWDGTDGSGTSLPDGTYSMSVSATGSDGSALSVSTSTSGTVSGVSTVSGATVLTTTDGRSVSLSNVTGVVAPATTS